MHIFAHENVPLSCLRHQVKRGILPQALVHMRSNVLPDREGPYLYSPSNQVLGMKTKRAPNLTIKLHFAPSGWNSTHTVKQNAWQHYFCARLLVGSLIQYPKELPLLERSPQKRDGHGVIYQKFILQERC